MPSDQRREHFTDDQLQRAVEWLAECRDDSEGVTLNNQRALASDLQKARATVATLKAAQGRLVAALTRRIAHPKGGHSWECRVCTGRTEFGPLALPEHIAHDDDCALAAVSPDDAPPGEPDSGGTTA